jgi:hypothetical protein
MTTCAVVVPSWVTIDLDTTPPLLVIDAPKSVEPPDDWIVIVRANEDLGPVAMTFTDTYGAEVSVGYERVGPRTLAASIPTVGLSSGAGELKVIARDRACNATTVVQTVVLLRPRAFDVVLTIDSGIAGESSMSNAFDAEIDVEHAHVTQSSVDHAYEATADVRPAQDTTMEITNG